MEGPLVSDTTEFLSGAADAPGETPLGRPAPAGNADPEGSRTGSSAPAGPDGAAAARGRRRQGTGLSALLLPELQQVAHQMGIPGTARMRKSQLIAAIQEKQGGTADRSSRPGPGAAATEVSAPRAASAGADVSRPVKQDAMEPQTSPETGSRRNGQAGDNDGQSSSRGDAAVQQLSFDQAPTGEAPHGAPAGHSQQNLQAAAAEGAAEPVRGDGQQGADGARGDRRRRNNNARDARDVRDVRDARDARDARDPA